MICKLMAAADKLSKRDPARAKFLRSVVCAEVNWLYLADE